MPDSFVFVFFIVDTRLKHDAESEIEKVNLVPFQMIPHGPRFVVVFRVNCSGSTIHGIDPGSF